ncbi:hypothetical protein AtNW77_Chr5g0096051 [Arabidopsis thaliana]
MVGTLSPDTPDTQFISLCYKLQIVEVVRSPLFSTSRPGGSRGRAMRSRLRYNDLQLEKDNSNEAPAEPPREMRIHMDKIARVVARKGLRIERKIMNVS